MKPAILLVDNELFMLTLLNRILSEMAPDYELLNVVRGAGALNVIAQRPIALVITDHAMPTMDGVTLITAIKAILPTCPVILMTGHPSSGLEQRARAAGAEYLAKPFTIEQLAVLVQSALQQ